jgi:transposase
MSHPNAILAPKGRLQLAKCVVDEGWTLQRAAERFQIAVTTAARWARRYREHGEAGMTDRSSRPHRSPNRIPMKRERRIIGLRVNQRWGPDRIGYRLGIQPSTVHSVLSRYGLAKLKWQDRATGRTIRRYEHEHPGDLVHVDIKKQGRIPDGGGHRILGKAAGNRNRTGTEANRRPGYMFLHNASMTTPGWPTPRSCPMRKRKPPRASGNGQTSPDRQRGLLPLPRLQRRARRRHQAQTHPPLPSADQRQSRTLQPHHARGMGLRKTLSFRSRACCSVSSMAP